MRSRQKILLCLSIVMSRAVSVYAETPSPSAAFLIAPIASKIRPRDTSLKTINSAIYRGWDSVTGEIKSACWEGPAIPPGGLTPVGETQFQETTGYEKTDIFRKDSLAIAAAFNYGAASGSAYYNDVKTSKLSKYTDSLDAEATVAYKPVTPGDETGSGGHLIHKYEVMLATQQAKFFRTCGDSYIAGIKFGGTVRVSFLSAASTRSESETVSEGIKAGYESFRGGVSGSIDHTSESKFDQVSDKVTVQFYKDGVITPIPETKPDAIGAFVRNSFINELNDCSKTVQCAGKLANGFVIRRYGSVVDGMFQYGSSASKYIRMIAKLQDLQFLTRGVNRDSFDFVDFNLASDAANKLAIDLASIETDFQGCLDKTNQLIRTSKQVGLTVSSLASTAKPCVEKLDAIVQKYSGIIVPPRRRTVEIKDEFLKTSTPNLIVTSNYSCTNRPESEDDCDSLVDSSDDVKAIPFITQSKGVWSSTSPPQGNYNVPADRGTAAPGIFASQEWTVRSGAAQIAGPQKTLGTCQLLPGEELYFHVVDGPDWYSDNVQVTGDPARIDVSRPLTKAAVNGLHLCLR